MELMAVTAFLLLFQVASAVTIIVVDGNVYYGNSRYEWTAGACILQLYEPCSSNQKILYHVFSKGHEESTLYNLRDSRLPDWYNSSLPLKVIIHGFAGRWTDSTNDLRKAYLDKGGVNVLVVDWRQLAVLPCYPTATMNTGQVGRCVGEMLYNLAPVHGPETVHLIGFSLGAHIAAYASNYLQIYTGKLVSRITGLDPALPFFATLKDSWKLDPSDAEFVDVIHTNAGLFGKIEPAGHVDFYVNDGTHQPACDQHKNPPLCSHLLAPTYYAESITSDLGFWGTPCPSYIQYFLGWCPALNTTEDIGRILMGEYVSDKSQGVYIVKTNSTAPYALG